MSKVVAVLKADIKHLGSECNDNVLNLKSIREPKKYGSLLSDYDSIESVLSAKPPLGNKPVEKHELSQSLVNEVNGDECANVGNEKQPLRANAVEKKVEVQDSESDKISPSDLHMEFEDRIEEKGRVSPIVVDGGIIEKKPQAVSVKKENDPSSKVVGKKNSSNKKSSSERPEPVFAPKAEFTFGSSTLTGEIVGRCKHSGKVSHLATDLLVKLFSVEELALGNLTGKTPNGHKKYVLKKKLDEGRIQGIIDYIATFLSKEMTKDQVSTEVFKAISIKLNNLSKTDKAKSIIENHVKLHPEQLVKKMADDNATQ